MNRTEVQARRVTFSEIWNRFTAPFNKDYFPPAPRYSKEIRIEQNNTVIFPGTSSGMSALGYNCYGGCVDEACFLEVIDDSKKHDAGGESDQYDAAEDIHNAMMNRMTSRFMKAGTIPGILVMFSSPRFPEDFLNKKIRQADELGDESGIFYKVRPTWSAKGRLYYPSKNFFYVDTSTFDIIEDEAEALSSPEYKILDPDEKYLEEKSGLKEPDKLPKDTLVKARQMIQQADDKYDEDVVTAVKGLLKPYGQGNPSKDKIISLLPLKNRLRFEIRDGQWRSVQKAEVKDTVSAFNDQLVKNKKIANPETL